MDFAHAALVTVVLLLMLVGLAGTILPVVPDLILIWFAGLAYGLLWGFGKWGPWLFAAMTVLMLFGYGLNLFVTHLGAATKGASWPALLASLLLAAVGFFVIPIVGAFVGAVLGIFLVEYHRRKETREAWEATKGALLGFALGFGVQVAVGVTMILVWGLWVWVG